MLTGKQRASLRGMANTLQPIFQIGKGGLNENLLDQLDDALRARELIKISILETAGLDTRETCDELARLLRAEPVQCLGRKLVLYRRNHENPKIEI